LDSSGVAVCFGTPLIIFLFIVAIWALSCIQILNEYERGVIFRFGRIPGGSAGLPKGPGIIFVFRPVDRIVRISTRTITMDVPPQDVISKDNISIKVSAVIYFHVVNPISAVVKVENFLYATSQLSQTTLRAVLGQAELDELLSQRDKINMHLQEILDKHTEPWGVKVTMVEVKQIDLPPDMQRAMAKQAEAEREKRAKIISADGEYQASQKLTDAARVIATQPNALQLRFLQTLVEVSAEKNSTIIFPVPIDLFEPFLRAAGRPLHADPRPVSQQGLPSQPHPQATPPPTTPRG
jgi:regulator of protease activity HflC (stomatin/prohibitin superfamily)